MSGDWDMPNRDDDEAGLFGELVYGNDPSCWIDRAGKVTWVATHGGSHCRAAEAIGDKTGGVELERQGYLHISWTSVYTGYDAERGDYLDPSQPQLDALFDIAQAIEATDEYLAKRYMEFISQHQVKETA